MNKTAAYQVAISMSLKPTWNHQPPKTEEKQILSERYKKLYNQLHSLQVTAEQAAIIEEFTETAEDIEVLEVQDAFIAGFMTCFEMMKKNNVNTTKELVV